MRKIVWLILVAVLGASGWLAWAVLAFAWAVPRRPCLRPAFRPDVRSAAPGYSTRRIAAELKSAGVIRSEEAFILWHYIHHGRSLKAGEYLFDKPANIIDIQKRLRRGDVYFHTVVVPEGFTMFDIAPRRRGRRPRPRRRLPESGGVRHRADRRHRPGSQSSLEGYLFPETYEFSRMMTMQEMAAAMVKQFRQVAPQIGSDPNAAISLRQAARRRADSYRRAAEEAPNDVERTVIMASIVEKETAVAEERPLVASVYYNRLNKNIALDADPSIIYAELLAGTYQGALHHADMQFSSPYNTYRQPGLPPGPIGNPGRSALEAAMHPAQSDYYYFVADAQGHHRFARTMEEHNKNVAAYRKAMRGK